MQAAQAPDGLVAGTQVQVIRVGQDDLGVEIFQQRSRQDAFDCGLRADGHEDRRFHLSVGGVKDASAGAGVRADRLKFEAEHSLIV